jgi:hypothetical protein
VNGIGGDILPLLRYFNHGMGTVGAGVLRGVGAQLCAGSMYYHYVLGLPIGLWLTLSHKRICHLTGLTVALFTVGTADYFDREDRLEPQARIARDRIASEDRNSTQYSDHQDVDINV